MKRQPYVIVIADDDNSIADGLKKLLERQGYSVTACYSGEQAYRASVQLQPDVVITDVSMETDDAGFRLLERLKAEPTTASSGVIVWSGDRLMLEQHDSWATSLGAVVLQKPLHKAVLLAAVQQLLPG